MLRIAERIDRTVGQQLVGLVRPGVETDLDELQLQSRLGVEKHCAVDHLSTRHGARLRAEPTLARDVVDELLLVDHSPSSFRNWNQKNPRGAKVSK